MEKYNCNYTMATSTVVNNLVNYAELKFSVVIF